MTSPLVFPSAERLGSLPTRGGGRRGDTASSATREPSGPSQLPRPALAPVPRPLPTRQALHSLWVCGRPPCATRPRPPRRLSEESHAALAARQRARPPLPGEPAAQAQLRRAWSPGSEATPRSAATPCSTQSRRRRLKRIDHRAGFPPPSFSFFIDLQQCLANDKICVWSGGVGVFFILEKRKAHRKGKGVSGGEGEAGRSAEPVRAVPVPRGSSVPRGSGLRGMTRVGWPGAARVLTERRQLCCWV